MNIFSRRHYSTAEEIGKGLVADHLRNVAALAEPFPSSVSYAHFIKRDLGAAIEAGRCTVTMPHPVFASLPGICLVDVTRLPDGIGYLLTTFDGSEWKRYSQGDLAVTWHDAADGWDKLTLPMRHALRFLAGEGGHKPRWNTLRALEKRRFIRKGKLTPSALTLYRQHQGDFEHG